MAATIRSFASKALVAVGSSAGAARCAFPGGSASYRDFCLGRFGDRLSPRASRRRSRPASCADRAPSLSRCFVEAARWNGAAGVPAGTAVLSAVGGCSPRLNGTSGVPAGMAVLSAMSASSWLGIVLGRLAYLAGSGGLARRTSVELTCRQLAAAGTVRA
jgi:hypothetical protein